MIDSEDCESKGMRMVATKKECEDAAVFLKLTDTSADELLQNEDLAPGCIYQNNRWLAWASLKNHSDPNKPCGTSQWVVLHKLLIASSCICASRSGKPYNSTALKQLNHRLKTPVLLELKFYHIFHLQLLVLMGNRIKEKLILTAEGHVLRAQLAMMVFRIREKWIMTAEDHVLHAQLAMMVLRMGEKLILTAEDHVLCAQLVTMVFRIKEKLPLIAEVHVLQIATV